MKTEQASKIKSGAIILIIGRQHSGKSPIAKRLATESNKKNKIVLDFRHEYDSTKFTVFYSIEKFKKLLSWITGSFIIVEEATTFINSFKDFSFVEAAAGVEHKNNTIVFLFHSIADAPKYLLRLSRFVILLPTNDDKDLVKRSHPKLFPYMGEAGDVLIDLNKIN